MPKKMKILQVLPELKSGGVERGTIEIARAIVESGNESFVISNGGPLVEDLKKAKSKHVRMPVHSKNLFVILYNIVRLARYMKDEKIDIVHARSRAPAWSCYFATKIAGCKFITTFHGAYEAGHALKRLYNSVMLKGHKVIAISNFILKHIETRYRFVSDDMEVIHRGVDLDYFNPEKVSAKRIADMKKHLGVKLEGSIIIVPARLTRLKGHLFMLHALKYLSRKKFTCLFVGKSSDAHNEYRYEIEQLIKDYGLSNKVHICDAVTDMPALYKISDIVVCPTITAEAFGRTITEAQAMERIIIATKIGAPIEIIDESQTGFLASPAEPSELAEKIQKAMELKDSEKSKIIKAAKSKVMKHFSLKTMCDKTIQLYKNALKEQ